MKYRRRMSLSLRRFNFWMEWTAHCRGTMISVESLGSVLTLRPFGLLWLRIHSEIQHLNLRIAEDAMLSHWNVRRVSTKQNVKALISFFLGFR